MIEVKVNSAGLRQAMLDQKRLTKKFLNEIGESVEQEWRDMIEETEPPSRPGMPPAVSSGDLIRSFNHKVTPSGISWFAKAYALYVNDSAAINRPFIEPGLKMAQKRLLPKIARRIYGSHS